MARLTRQERKDRNMQRIFDYHNARLEYYDRQLPRLLIAALALPTAFVLGYLGIQVWAWTITGRIYPAYFYPCVAIIGVYFLLAVIVGKMCRPYDEY